MPTGDDRGEFAAGANRVVYRIGTGANATLGGRLVPGAAVPVSFDVRIGDVQPRFEIVNAAAADVRDAEPADPAHRPTRTR